ncbi:MAG: AAA family ATPase [Desulfobulbaceae bacterium]|nr:AAA family ATPase [Desulfobulbaceae bacterium]
MNDPRGSIWRRWDLHYHTPSSYDVTANISNEDIVAELLSRNIAVVAITDHHTIDVERIQALQVIAGDRLTVFPGIEFRSELGGRESVHYIGLFPPEADLHHIWTTLQGKLSITSLDIENKGGNDAVYVDFQEGSKVIHGLGGVVSVHAGKKSNSIERISHATDYQRAVKVDLIEKCIDIFEAKDASDAEDYCRIVFPNIGTIRPIIVNSDKHHRAEDAVRPPCWIKADTTFSGLKRILVEPERVFIGPEPPALWRQRSNMTRYCDLLSYAKVSGSTFNEHWFSGEIPLNTGLVAVIGNKGSGKSAMADSLGLLGNSPREKYFSFLNSTKFRRPRERKAEQFSTTLRWLSGDVNECHLSDRVVSTSVETIKYIPQNYLEAICNEVAGGEGSDFDKEIKSVIFSHVADDARFECETFDELIEFRTNETHEHIKLLQRKLHDLNDRIVTLDVKLTDEFRQSLEQQLLQKQMELVAHDHDKAKPEEVHQPDKDPTVEDQNIKFTAEIQKLRVDLEQIQTTTAGISEQNKQCLRRKALAEKLKAKLDNLQRSFDDFVNSCVSECEELGIEVKELVAFEIRLAMVNDIVTKSQLESIEFSKMLLEDVEGTPAFTQKDLQKKINALLLTMDAANQKYQQYLEQLTLWDARRKEIVGAADISGSLKYYEAQIKELDEIPAILDAVKEQRTDTTRSIYQEIAALAKAYASLYSPIEKTIERDPLVKEGLQLGFSVPIVTDNFEERFFNLIHQGRRGTFCGAEEGQKKLRQMLSEADFSNPEGALAFVELIDIALRHDLREDGCPAVRVADLVRKGITLTSIYDFIFGLGYLFPRYALTWGSRTLDQLSPGERGALLLVFYLLVDNDTIPLVIDQPEENLDNESVFKILVPCIKKAKERRQVIIVTHNPNLAVVCDADQIIYSEMDKPGGNRITYSSGAIENPIINRHIVDVLEGTRPAFDIRDAKYKLVEMFAQ